MLYVRTMYDILQLQNPFLVIAHYVGLLKKIRRAAKKTHRAAQKTPHNMDGNSTKGLQALSINRPYLQAKNLEKRSSSMLNTNDSGLKRE